VVALPGDELGLRFSFGSSATDCCSLFPYVALDETPGTPHPTDVVIPVSDIGADGVLSMHMWRRDTGQKPAFRIDLAELGVPTT
jgi:hypothetical protein